MGSFCYVDHEGLALQCHVLDDFAHYRVGSELPWEPEFEHPGVNREGFWQSYPEGQKDAEPYCVVVQDNRIRSVSLWQQRPSLAQVGFKPPDPGLWCPQAWEAQAWRKTLADAEDAARRAAWRQAHPDDEVTDEVRAILASSAYFRARLRELSMFRLRFGSWPARHDLMAKLDLPALIAEFDAEPWPYTQRQRDRAVQYRCRRWLTEQGLWDEGQDRQRPLAVRVEFDPFEVEVVQFQDNPVTAPTPEEVR